LSSEERRQIGVAIGQLDKEPLAALIAERLRCDLAVHDGDQTALAVCAAKLEAAAPADWRTASFAWELSRQRKDPAGLAKAREHAQDLGAPAQVIARMDQGTRPVVHGSQRVLRGLRWGLVAALLLGLLAATYAAARRVRRLLLSRGSKRPIEATR
jgi:hypothetical protein